VVPQVIFLQLCSCLFPSLSKQQPRAVVIDQSPTALLCIAASNIVEQEPQKVFGICDFGCKMVEFF